MWTQSALSGCHFCNYEQSMQKLKRDVPHFYQTAALHIHKLTILLKNHIYVQDGTVALEVRKSEHEILYTPNQVLCRSYFLFDDFSTFLSKAHWKTFAFQISKGKKWNSRGLVSSCLKSVWFGGDPYFFMWNTNDWSHCTIDPERDRTVFDAKNVTKYWRARRSLNFQSIVQCFTFSSLN